MEIKQLIRTLYEYFYSKQSRVEFTLKDSERNKKSIEKFIALLKQSYNIRSIGLDWLFNYFVFQFQYWYNFQTQTNNTSKQSLQLTWIIGKKAYERFLQKEEFWRWLAAKKLLDSFDITMDEYIRIYINQSTIECYSHEDSEKEKFHNTQKGLLHCLEYTTLYFKKSKWCILCNNQKQCKQFLKELYPDIAKNRI